VRTLTDRPAEMALIDAIWSARVEKMLRAVNFRGVFLGIKHAVLAMTQALAADRASTCHRSPV
jgi:hypothetical protein